MKMTDGKRTVNIEIREWHDGSGYGPDWSDDYFNAGLLPYDEETETHTVESVDYCIEIASDRDNPESAVYGYDNMEVLVTELTAIQGEK